MNTPSRISFQRLILCALTCLVPAAGAARGHSPPEEKTKKVEPQATPTLFKPQVEDDPKKDGWESEVYSRRVDKRLKQITSLLSKPSSIDAAKAEGLLADDFACTPLRPELVEVFADDAVKVFRAKNQPARKKVHDFQAAIAELVSPYKDGSEIRAKFKTIHVGIDSMPRTTELRLETGGRVEGGAVQQTSVWLCEWADADGDESPRLQSIHVTDYEEVVARSDCQTLFTDCTRAVLGGNDCFESQLAIGTEQWLERMDFRIGYDTRGHHGLAIGDVDADGLDDVFLCQPGGLPDRLFLQNPDGSAREVSAAAGVDWLEQAHAALFLDLDNDGDQDLVLNASHGLMFLSNDGKGTFERRLQVKLVRPTMSLAAADFDHDADLDVYGCVFYPEKMHPGHLAHPLPLHDANNGGRNILFRNDITAGEWEFSDVTDEVNLSENNHRYSYAAVFEDYDDDGDMDLYVANDFGRNNLYRNDGGRFKDVAAEAGVEDQSFGMSASFGDYNRDGRMDLYVGNMFSAAGNRVTYQRMFKSDLADAAKEQLRYLARGNSMFQNLGGGKFADTSVETGTTFGRWAWSSFFVDMNNDGFEDVMVCNGYLTNTLNDDL